MQLSLLMLLLASSASVKTEITWLQLDWPPHQIVSGPYAGQGTYDLLSQQLTSRLPEFLHQRRLTNLQRMEQAFVQGEPGVCTMVGTLYSDERAKNRLFSAPMIISSKVAVAYVNTALHQHPSVTENRVRFQSLAVDAKLKGAYQPDRQYPPAITEAIGLPRHNLIAHNFTSEVNAVALLASGRVDYVLEYPERLNYFNQLLPQPVVLHYKSIAGLDIATESYIACSKDAAGQHAIKAINAVLPELWHDEKFLQAMRRWLDDNSWQQLAADVERIQQRNALKVE